MRVLVTGAAGFVGRHVCAALRARGQVEVHAVVRTVPSAAEPGQAHHVADVRDAAAVARLVARVRPTAIIHLAAQSSVGRSFGAPVDTFQANTLPILHLLHGCRAAGVDPQIVVAGSAEQYGQTARGGLPLAESAPRLPTSPYAASKVAQEELALQVHRAHGSRVVALRPFNHIGPGQAAGFVVPDFARQVARIEAGQQPPVLRVGNLSARRDFLDVRDVADAYVAAVERGHPGTCYNVGSGSHRPVRWLLEALLQASSVSIAVQSDPLLMRPVDLPVLVADAAAFRRATGWRPHRPLEQTLADVLGEWRARVAAGEA